MISQKLTFHNKKEVKDGSEDSDKPALSIVVGCMEVEDGIEGWRDDMASLVVESDCYNGGTKRCFRRLR